MCEFTATEDTDDIAYLFGLRPAGSGDYRYVLKANGDEDWAMSPSGGMGHISVGNSDNVFGGSMK